MEIALNGATTMKADLETDIRAAGEAGFDCLEIWASKLRNFLRSQSPDDLRDLFATHKIKPYSINSIERITFRDDATHKSLLAECEELCRIAERIRCPYIVVVPSPQPPGMSRSKVIEASALVLNELAEIAARHGLDLGSNSWANPTAACRRWRLRMRLLPSRPAKRRLVIDSFHFYAGGSTIESLEALDAERIFIFHINDAEDRPRDQLEDRHRLLPGLGILPLKQIVGALRRIGYDRTVSVEIFRPEYWERDPYRTGSRCARLRRAGDPRLNARGYWRDAEDGADQGWNNRGRICWRGSRRIACPRPAGENRSG
jgi:2-keto-myo-inositol isomerase